MKLRLKTTRPKPESTFPAPEATCSEASYPEPEETCVGPEVARPEFVAHPDLEATCSGPEATFPEPEAISLEPDGTWPGPKGKFPELEVRCPGLKQHIRASNEASLMTVLVLYKCINLHQGTSEIGRHGIGRKVELGTIILSVICLRR